MRDIFKKSGESEEKDQMVDAYCEKFKHLKIDYAKIKEIRDELALELSTEHVIDKILIDPEQEVLWKWNVDIEKDYKDSDCIEFSNENYTMKKKGGSYWHTIVGDTVMEEGLHTWCLTIDEYSAGDKSGILFGICQSSEVADLKNTRDRCLHNKKLYGTGGSNNNY